MKSMKLILQTTNNKALKSASPCHSALLLNLCETGGVEVVYRHSLWSAEKATGACLLTGVVTGEDERKNTLPPFQPLPQIKSTAEVMLHLNMIPHFLQSTSILLLFSSTAVNFSAYYPGIWFPSQAF